MVQLKAEILYLIWTLITFLTFKLDICVGDDTLIFYFSFLFYRKQFDGLVL